MAIMCEECKSSMAFNGKCRECGKVGATLALREAQVMAITEEIREEYSEEHPIMYAEQGPNRYALMSLFFPEDDGVRIEEDLSTGEIGVFYFGPEGGRELMEGALYSWAYNFYKENY